VEWKYWWNGNTSGTEIPLEQKYRWVLDGNTGGMIHSLNESKSTQASKLTSDLLVKMQVPNSKHQNCNSFQVIFHFLDLLIIIYKSSFKGSYR
jgi:hypothetical protein